jgi:hypothetical protein
MAANVEQLRLEVVNIATQVNGQEKFRRPCYQLVIRDCEPGSQAGTVKLRRVLGALQAVHSNPQARLISMAKLKVTMKDYKYFRDDHPDHTQDVGGLVPLNAIIRYYMRDPQTSRLYGYEVGS